jgi:hypothetical protein
LGADLLTANIANLALHDRQQQLKIILVVHHSTIMEAEGYQLFGSLTTQHTPSSYVDPSPQGPIALSCGTGGMQTEQPTGHI